MRAPDSWSCPEEASASELAQEGFWFLWDVLSCLSGHGGLSCHRVLFCPVLSVWPWRAVLSCFVLSCLFSPGGLIFFFWGGSRVPAVGAGPRGSKPRAPKTIRHGLQSSQLRHGPQSSQLRHGLQSSQLRHGLQSSLHRHGFQSSQLRHGPCLSVLFCSGGPRPAFLSVSVLRGLQNAHPPSPMELLRFGTSLSGGGSYVSPLPCVSCVPTSCFLIWFVSCPCLMSLLVNSCPAVFV